MPKKSKGFDLNYFMKELEQDIAEMGGETIMKVIVEDRAGNPFYREYFQANAGSLMPDVILNPTECYTYMTATALMEVYKVQKNR